FASGHAALARGHDLVDQRKKPASAFTRERGEKNDGRIIEELQLFTNQFFVVAHQLHRIEGALFGLRLFLNGGSVLRGFQGEVPFIYDHNKRAAGLLRVTGDSGVVRSHSQRAIDDEQRHVRAFKMTPRHHHAQLFSDETRFAFAADACRVEKPVHFSVLLDDGVNGIARSTGLCGNNRAIFADHAIEKRRFPYVWTSNNGDVDFRRRLGRSAGDKIRGQRIEKIVDAKAMLARNREDLRAQFVKRCGERNVFWRVDFIGDNYRRLARAAKKLRQFEIERDGARASVRNQNHVCRIFDRHVRLAKNFSGDTGFVFWNDSARVDHLERPAFPFRGSVDAVTGNAGLVGDDRPARAGQAIEERRFAYVGS